MRNARNSRADDSSAAPRDSYSGGGGRGFGDSYDRGASRGGFRGGSSSGSRYGDDAGSGARGGGGFSSQRRPYQSDDAEQGGDEGADFMVRAVSPLMILSRITLFSNCRLPFSHIVLM